MRPIALSCGGIEDDQLDAVSLVRGHPGRRQRTGPRGSVPAEHVEDRQGRQDQRLRVRQGLEADIERRGRPGEIVLLLRRLQGRPEEPSRCEGRQNVRPLGGGFRNHRRRLPRFQEPGARGRHPVRGQVNIYGRMKYDTIAETYNEILFGAKMTPMKDVILRGEYYQSYATFDTISIYSVFAVDKYKEGSLSAEYRLNGKYRVSARYAKEDFGGDADADLFEVGFLANPIKDLTLNATYEKRDGYAGSLNGIRLNGEYKIARATLQAGVGYDDFRRELSRDGTAKKYWGAMNYEFSKLVSAVLRAEDNINFSYENSYQGFAAVNLNF